MMLQRLLLLVLMAFAGIARTEAAGGMEEAVASATAKVSEPRADSAPADAKQKTVSVLPATPGDLATSDEATRGKYLAAMQAYYDYRANGFEFRSKVFKWQHKASIAIFLLVVLLVLAGMYFAAVQFHVALAASKRSGKADAQPGMATQIELSAKGIVVNSSVLGVIITALSLAFFYLYLVYVYPIQDTF
jgi:hypothetical protein